MTSVRQIQTPPLTRQALVRAGSFRKEDRTITVTMSTGAIVRRQGWVSEWDEALPVGRARLNRLNSIGVVLDNHRTGGSVTETIGAVEPGTVRIEDNNLVGDIRFARTQLGDEVMALVEDGILRAVSLGYAVDEFEQTKAKDRKDGGTRDLLTPTGWEPYEVSVVQMPADAGATMRSAESAESITISVRSAEETTTMSELDIEGIKKAERLRYAQRLATFEGLAGDVPAETVRQLVTEFDDDGKVGLELLKLKGERQRATQITSPQVRVEMGATAEEKTIEARSLGLAARMLPTRYGDKLTDAAAKASSRAPLLDLARECVRAAGVRGVDTMSKRELAELALSPSLSRSGGYQSTSDFPYLLANTQNKILLDLYTERVSPWRAFARRMDRPDFKSFTMPRRSAAPSLLAVEESGKIQQGSYAENTPETGKLATAAIAVSFTRQMLINDDLGAFTENTLGLAASAIRYEDDTVNTIITSNPTMADGVALFHANHGNISADTGAPDIDAIHAAMLTMAAQTGLKSERLNLRPAFLYGAFKEYLTARQTLATPDRMLPTTASNVAVPEALGLQLLWDNRLSDGSGISDWYLIADPNQIAGIYYGGLEGDTSPRLSMDVEFLTDGIMWKLVHDFYAEPADYRWIVQTPDA